MPVTKNQSTIQATTVQVVPCEDAVVPKETTMQMTKMECLDTNGATSNSLGSNGLHGRIKSISNINVNGNGSYVDQRNDQVMNLLRSRGLSHGYGGRKRNKRLQATLKVPLAESVKQLVSLYREADAWQLLGVEDDVRISLLKPDIAQERGLAYPTPIGK